jgi:PilZ domain
MRRSAQVIFAGVQTPIGCVIWDISDGGARLTIASPLASLPHTFTLSLFKDASLQRKCEVVWTDARFVGVKFV